MAFVQESILRTKKDAYGSHWLGQTVAFPSGRIDKASPYLEPIVADPIAAQSISVIAEIYALDVFGIPTGVPLVSDSIPLSQITVRGHVNFRLEAYVPTLAALILRVPAGDASNCVSWRYEDSSSGAGMLLSSDGGSSWSLDATKTFSYRAFSIIPDAIDYAQQTAAIQAGTLETITDDSSLAFSLGEFERTAVVGDTVQIAFGQYVVTLVVDQSGSMTWNDRAGLRFDFLRDLVSSLDTAISPLPGASVKFSIVKFRSRRIAKMNIAVAGTAATGLQFDGVRVLRKAGVLPPLNASDGTVAYAGSGELFQDYGLVAGTPYQYAAYSYFTTPTGTLFSDEGRLDYGIPGTPTVPLVVAGLKSELIITDNAGTPLATGATDLGYRKVVLTWLNPAGFDYSNILLIQRTDRFPDSPTDGVVDGTGTVLLPFTTLPATTFFVDDFGSTFQPIDGLTYYYALFTANILGVKCPAANAQKSSILAMVPDRPWERTDPIGVPPVRATNPQFSHIPSIPTATVTECSGAVRLDWADADPLATRFKLFYNGLHPPLPTDDKGKSYDGEVLYDGTGHSHTHRFLENGQPCFYALVAFDDLEGTSLPLSISARPSATSTSYVPPLPVSSFTVEVLGSSSTNVGWTNPSAPASQNLFWFGDVVNISASVDFLDSGTSESFSTFEFVEDSRNVKGIDGQTAIPAAQAILFSKTTSPGASSIKVAVSTTPFLQSLNTLETATITLHAELAVKNRATGAVVAKVASQSVTVTFRNPFALGIGNDPPQTVSVRTWTMTDSNGCEEWDYKVDTVPGVYVLSGKPFFAVISSSFKDAALGQPLDVTLQLLDKATGLPTQVITMPQAAGQPSFTLQTSDQTDDNLDRTGQPDGTTTTKTLLPLTLPPGNAPGLFTLQATATFQGYIRTTSLDVRYEPVLNIDLNLAPYQPDGNDITEQSAFVYLAPFDASNSEKAAVQDLTVTEWSIRPLCKTGKDRPLRSEDSVPGSGSKPKSYTRGGLAQKIFWGPGTGIFDRQLYEVKVTVQANGMAATGYGVMGLNPASASSANRIFLRAATTITHAPTDFFLDDLCANGVSSSPWEVVARPEDDGVVTDPSSGKYFRNAVLAINGQVPSLDDGTVVTMVATVEGDGATAAEIADILKGVIIVTDLNPQGKSTTADATIVSGKSSFLVYCNAKVPPAPATPSFGEPIKNIAYDITFNKPSSGAYIVLSVYIPPLDVSGHSTSFTGGGGDVRTSTPPAFIELIEPLESTSQ